MCSHQFVYHHIPIHIPLVTSFSQEKTWSKQQTPCELRARRLPRKGAMPMLSILAPAASHASMTNSWFISLTFLWIYDVYIYMYICMYIYAPETMDGQVLWLAIYSLVYLPIWLGDVWCKCWSIFQAMSSVQRLGKQSCSISFGLIFPLKWTWSLTTG